MRTHRLRHLARVASSSVDKKSHEGETPVRLCNYTDVYNNDEVRPGEHLMRATATADEIRRFRLHVGDTVITKDSEDPNDIGVAAFIPETAPDFVCGYHLAVIRPRDSVDPKFLYWSLRSRTALDHFSLGANGTTRYGLGLDTISSVPIPWATMSQQRRIADFLDDQVLRIDNIIAARHQWLSLAEEAAASSRRVCIIGPEVIAADLPWAPLIGADRQVRRLSQLARLGTGHTPSRNNADYWVDCTIPWLTTADVHKFRRDEISVLWETEFKISELGLANSAAVLHPAGTVALSRTASAGFPIVMGQPMATSQDFATWTCGPDLRPAFLLGTLRVMRDYLLRYLSMGSTHKTIYFPDLEAIRVVLPELKAQDAAIAQMDAIDERRASARSGCERSIALLTEYKQSLITAAVTGELDVTTASRRVPA